VTYVLDASVAACWCFQDEQDNRAHAAIERLADERALAPSHWWFEVRNILLVGERRSRISETHSTQFLVRLERLPIDLAPLPDATAIFTLARRHRLTFYDAAYLEVAQRENMALATLDDALAAAASTEGVMLIGS
jgi:predicted nucleic acid-binding protein